MQDETTPTPPRRDSRKLERVEGHPGIFRRGGRYVAVVYARGKQTKLYGKTIAEAKRKRAAVVTDVDRGEYHGGGRETFEEFGRAWLDRYEGRTGDGVRSHTLAQYRETLERDAFPALGSVKLRDLTLPMLKAYQADLEAGRRKGFSMRKGKNGKPIPMAGKKLSRNSVRLAMAPIKAMLADATEEGVLRANPAAQLRTSVKRTKRRAATKLELERQARTLTDDQLKALLHELSVADERTSGWTDDWKGRRPWPYRLLFGFLASTGCRIGEALGLRWECVDLSGGRVLIRERFYRGTFDEPKSDYGTRYVPLTPEMVRSLGNLWREARPESGDALVFASAAGGPVDYANVYRRVFKPAAARAGVPWATAHTLRHTYKTMLERNGYRPEEISTLLGHHAVEFTANAYGDRPGDVRAPEIMDAITRGAVGSS